MVKKPRDEVTKEDLESRYGPRIHWFMDRIGKRIYRNKSSCKCPTCTDVGDNGLIVSDRDHACYLCACEGDMDLEYRDEK